MQLGLVSMQDQHCTIEWTASLRTPSDLHFQPATAHKSVINIYNIILLFFIHLTNKYIYNYNRPANLLKNEAMLMCNEANGLYPITLLHYSSTFNVWPFTLSYLLFIITDEFLTFILYMTLSPDEILNMFIPDGVCAAILGMNCGCNVCLCYVNFPAIGSGCIAAPAFRSWVLNAGSKSRSAEAETKLV